MSCGCHFLQSLPMVTMAGEDSCTATAAPAEKCSPSCYDNKVLVPWTTLLAI